MTTTSIVEDTAGIARAVRALKVQRDADALEAGIHAKSMAAKTPAASNPRPFTGTLYEAPGIVEAVARVLPNVRLNVELADARADALEARAAPAMARRSGNAHWQSSIATASHELPK